MAIDLATQRNVFVAELINVYTTTLIHIRCSLGTISYSTFIVLYLNTIASQTIVCSVINGLGQA
jgi:hypothetical protein